jgi:iron(III) transport system ATP-binding protein
LALARALVTEPALILLDEPLSNLDAKLRESMRLELKRLQHELGLTTVYVTHDQDEALALSTVIAVMKDGKVVQVGNPTEVYERPNCRFVAEFIGTTNLITGVVSAASADGSRISMNEGEVWTADRSAAGSEVLLSIRPEDLHPHVEQQPGAPNHWLGRVVTRAFRGDAIDYVVTVGKHELRCRTNPSTSIRPGTDVFVTVAPDRVRLIPDAP